ncbi:MAG: hypothetical protein M5T61_07695 [Acidimicrobiia bacterium]|nr:hypothetical protein [Acidimicrobiia bacterium]
MGAGSRRFVAAYFAGNRTVRRVEIALFAPRGNRWPALQAVNLAGLAVDAMAARRVRDGPPNGYGWRIPFDVADQAFWESAIGDDTDAQSWGQVSLALETTARYGLRGLGAPLAVFAATSAIRRARGGPWRPGLALWTATGALEGLLWSRTRKSHGRHVARRHDQDAAAAAEAAFLAGQHSVAMGADSVVDAIEGVAPLLGPPDPDSALLRLLDAWKSSLAVRAGSVGTYLGIALAKWERRRNLHPDLSSHVAVHLPEGEGTVILTGAQVAALDALLDASGLRGRVEVRSHVGSGHIPGRAVTLEVDGAEITVPEDPDRPPSVYDPAPVLLAAGIPGMLGVARHSSSAVPASAVLPPALILTTASALAARSRGARSGEATARSALAVTLLAGALHTVATTLGQRRGHSESGRQNIPFTYALEVPAFLLGYLWATTTPGERARGAAALGAVAAAGTALLPRPRQARAVLSELVNAASLVRNGRDLDSALRDDARTLGESFTAERERRVAESFESGRRLVVDLVREAHRDAVRRLDEIEGRTDPEIVAAARSRLAGVEWRLAALESAGAPS